MRLGDTQLPLLVSPPTGNWLLGLGPTFLLLTATRSELGQEQWGAGPTLVVGYKTKDWTEASSRSTPGVLAGGMVRISLMPAISACSISTSTTCPMPGRSVVTRRLLTTPGQLRQQVECSRRTHGCEDDQDRKGAGQIAARHGVLGRQPGRIRAAGADKAEHNPDNSLTGPASDFGGD